MTEPRRLSRRFNVGFTLPDALQPGSEVRRWLSVTRRVVLVIADVGLLVAGTGLVGIGLSLTLDGLGVISLVVDADLGQALAVGLVITMIGGFLIGVAVEGPIGHIRSPSPGRPWERLLIGVVALIAFVWFLGLLERLSDRLLLPHSELFGFVAAHLNEVQRAGLAAGLIVGLPVMWALRQFVAPRLPFFEEGAPAALYLVWMIAVIVA